MSSVFIKANRGALSSFAFFRLSHRQFSTGQLHEVSLARFRVVSPLLNLKFNPDNHCKSLF